MKSGRSTPTLAVENLESRLNLSTVAAIAPSIPAVTDPFVTQEVGQARTHLYGYASLSAGQTNFFVSTDGAASPNASVVDGQRPFDTFRNRFRTPSTFKNAAPFLAAAPTAAPVPAPTPAPTPTSAPVTVSQQNEGSLTRLVITGTTGNDSIIVSQSASTLTIIANGNTSTVTGNFGEIAIYGGDGSDTITVQSSVNIASLLYGGTGTNILTAGGSGQNYIVTIGAGNDTLKGNGVNTAFWADSGDVVNASAAETTGGDVHRVSGFYGGVSTALSGQNLADPTDSGAVTNLANRSLFGTNPAMTDVNQGQVGDCYFLASIQSFANQMPARLQEMAVDLGDGTYAVQFKRSGTTTYVRVDGDLPTAPWGGLLYNRPSGTGPIWASIMEKAYAFFRRDAGTYASLTSGWTGSVFSDLGVANTAFSTSGTASTVFNTISAALSANKAVAIISTPSASSPVIASHAYSIVSASSDSTGAMWLVLRNPWGIDGAGNDGVNDGLIRISLAQLQANFSMGSISS